MDPLKALGTDSKVKQGWDDTGNDTYTKPAPQPTDSSITSRILNVEGVATRKAAETNVEDRTTTTIPGSLLSDVENVAAYERGNITARNAK
jgi:hypothetical protein